MMGLTRLKDLKIDFFFMGGHLGVFERERERERFTDLQQAVYNVY